MSSPLLRIILCGKTAAVGKEVIAGLKPEYEVVRFITSFEDARRDIPLLLSGNTKDLSKEEGTGSHDYTKIPDGVMLGQGYDKDDVADLEAVCKQQKVKKVPFFLGDRSKPAPPYGPLYGPHIMKRAKEALEKWRNDPEREKLENPVWY
ncbi:uncharacterized protein I303_106835 [Kwoniella dejecticola CBS 10117]|uniref:NAD(P)-binding domain-containing protein n=1 Tax=Kwoniella dejecticola CBS 10117 TaxID=1296121 RepID=A0A1A5ZTP3_9TREE|nr:uncharacterized protein I303_08523 [Kwoniella dejecticola CBS 10117]OBR81140.1 hypothetical protein I303_08523 [Kwoniella dejecticola CBS 10117]